MPNRRRSPASLVCRGAAALLVAAASSLVSEPSAQADSRGVLLVVANRISMDDVRKPGFEQFLRSCRIGLISPQLTGRPQEGAAFATISAGSPSRGAEEYGLVLEAQEPFEGGPAAEAYARRTAFPDPPAGLVHLGMARVDEANRKFRNRPEVWLLGDTLREAGIARAAFGSSDLAEESLRIRNRVPAEARSRMGAALLADRYGLVPQGTVGAGSMQKAPLVPGGLATDLGKLTPKVLQSLGQGCVVALEFGDLERIEQERANCTPEAYALSRTEALERLGAWLIRVRRSLPATPVILISPVPPLSEDGRWDRLGFAAMSGTGTGQQLLVSNSTRTAGIIAAIDIAPTLLEEAGVSPPAQMTGYKAHVKTGRSPLETLRRWDLTVRLKRELGLPVILGLGLFAAASAGLAMWYLLRGQGEKKTASVVLLALALTAWIPFLLLVPLDRPYLYLTAAPGVLAGFLVAAKSKGARRFAPVELPALALLVCLALSAFGALDWTKRSPLCPWQFSGLRYYGIGNEFMGCILGAAAAIPLWRFGRPRDKAPMGWLAGWFAFWVLILGLPMLGANFGGVVASTVTFGLVARALTGRATRARDAAILTLAGVLAAFALAILDSAVSGWAPSHLGHTVRVLQSGDGNYMMATLQRKLALNLQLWTSSVGVLTAAIFATVLVAWGLHHRRLLAAVSLPDRIAQGLIGIGYGALVALVFNDSGIVSVAFVLAIVMLWWLWDAVTHKAGGLPAVRRRVAHTGR